MIKCLFEIGVIIISEDSSLPKTHLISISNEVCRFSQSLLHAPFCPSNIRGLSRLFLLFYVCLILIASPPHHSPTPPVALGPKGVSAQQPWSQCWCSNKRTLVFNFTCDRTKTLKTCGRLWSVLVRLHLCGG